MFALYDITQWLCMNASAVISAVGRYDSQVTKTTIKHIIGLGAELCSETLIVPVAL